MGRKAKQPGGHNPLTYHEARRLTYGTQTTRLGTDSQRKFGYCCLGLEPAKDPVVTPSGHVYSREAIVSYLLAKTKELKEEQAALEARRVVKERLQEKEEQISAQQKYMEFLQKDQGTIQYSQATHSKALTARLQKDICIDSKGEKRKQLAKTSYWLADFNPEVVSTTLTVPTTASTDDIHKRVPRRPTSPMTGQPLRLKDLVSIKLHREDNSTSLSSPDNVRFMCPVSGKVITHQAVIAIRKTGTVMLASLYDDLVKEANVVSKKRKSIDDEHDNNDKEKNDATENILLLDPITGQKFKKMDVIHLQRAASGFAASGNVQAKKYVPTLT